MRIDSHHHFWNYDVEQYGWIGDEMAILKRDFLPADLAETMRTAEIDGVVSVQARQDVAETEALLRHARSHAWIRGVVGWVPLASPQIDEVLDRFAGETLLKGVRHVVQDEPNDQFILGSDFNRGVAQLHARGWVYDILVFSRHLPHVIPFVDRHPNQSFVLDHIAKPVIRFDAFDETWARELRELGKRSHVSCKFSGVVTEVREPEWSIELLRPYWQVALDSFGPDRLMFGSDWPVCLLKSSYERWVATVSELASELSEAEQRRFWGDNAVRIYGLETD